MHSAPLTDRWGGKQKWSQTNSNESYRLKQQQAMRSRLRREAKQRRRNEQAQHRQSWLEFNIGMSELNEMQAQPLPPLSHHSVSLPSLDIPGLPAKKRRGKRRKAKKQGAATMMLANMTAGAMSVSSQSMPEGLDQPPSPTCTSVSAESFGSRTVGTATTFRKKDPQVQRIPPRAALPAISRKPAPPMVSGEQRQRIQKMTGSKSALFSEKDMALLSTLSCLKPPKPPAALEGAELQRLYTKYGLGEDEEEEEEDKDKKKRRPGGMLMKGGEVFTDGFAKLLASHQQAKLKETMENQKKAEEASRK